MRNFEERKAEILNRSNKRLQIKKRNQNRIITGCMSLCLLIMISLVVVIMPKITDEGDNPHDEKNENLYGENISSIQIYDEIINDCEEFIDSETKEESENGTGTNVEYAPEEDDMAPAEVFDFITVDSLGNEIHYKLQGNTLYNKTDGSMKNLTEEEVEKIKEKFGLGK